MVVPDDHLEASFRGSQTLFAEMNAMTPPEALGSIYVKAAVVDEVAFRRISDPRDRKWNEKLADDLVEVAAGEGLLDFLVDPPVWGPVSNVGLVGAATTGEQGDDTASSVEDDGA